MKVTPAQLGALQIIAMSHSDEGISESTLKKMRGLKIIERGADRLHVLTDLGRAVLAHHDTLKPQDSDDERSAYTEE